MLGELRMIVITKVDDVEEVEYDYVKCPVCKSRLCNKVKGTEMHLLQFSGSHIDKKIDQLLIHCRKCKSKYLFSVEDN